MQSIWKESGQKDVGEGGNPKTLLAKLREELANVFQRFDILNNDALREVAVISSSKQLYRVKYFNETNLFESGKLRLVSVEAIILK